ncbi:hypothetical protein [Kineococcus aurantiacus]|uniref:Uncharacterized protein n=1 Tax=Kineococcus aurantiacus TaxID=37633 RepID=A0A7Y9DIG1_9ACTN|nr:hypothetical protein [Kineococcus aurantiacus]NYD21460.1 hypothetical protein [Kineococcus aurantiacus]
MNQTDALARWWASLDARGRRDVLEVEPGDFLSESLALDLQLYGVHVPDVAVAFDVDGDLRRIVVHVQPRGLTDFLSSVR